MARTTKVKHRLSGVSLDEISLVKAGDNKGAHVLLLKTKKDEDKGESNMAKTVEELQKELEASEAKVAELEKACGSAEEALAEEKKKKMSKVAPGEKCPTCGAVAPVKKSEEIDKSALPEAVVKQLEAIEKKNADNEAKIAKMQDDTLTTECITKAAAIPTVGKTADISALLKDIAKVDQSLSDKVYDVLKGVDTKIQAGGLFKEIGTSEGDSGDTAIQKIEKKAVELRKAKPTLTKEQAWTEVYDSDEELAAAYRKENR